MNVPGELLDSVQTSDWRMVDAWWSSLSEQHQDEVWALLDEEEFLPTIPWEPEDEAPAEFLDEDMDRYEYMIAHEIRPLGITMHNRTVVLPGVALLSPLWPPYPAEVRYRAWSLTDQLYSDLQAELDRCLQAR